MTDKLREALERIIALDVPVNIVDVMDSTAREAVEIAKAALAQQDASFKPITRAFKSDIDRLKTYNSVDIYTLPVGATGDVTLYIKE